MTSAVLVLVALLAIPVGVGIIIKLEDFVSRIVKPNGSHLHDQIDPSSPTR